MEGNAPGRAGMPRKEMQERRTGHGYHRSTFVSRNIKTEMQIPQESQKILLKRGKSMKNPGKLWESADFTVISKHGKIRM